MNDLLIVVAILISNSVLNIITWAFILGKTGSEIRNTIQKIQDTIGVMKGE